MKQFLAPQQDKYKKILQQNPASKVFAPLADIYRKYAMFDEAFTVLQKGMRHNPDYIPGHLALARCHYDQGQYEDCYSILKPLVDTNKDNFKLQSLFFQVCEDLELWEEVLDTGRHLRYLNPHNEKWARRMRVLEGKHSSQSQDVDAVSGRKRALFLEEKLSVFPHDAVEWTEYNFFNGGQKEVFRGDEAEQSNLMDFYDKKFGSQESEANGWESVKKGLQSFCNAVNQRAASILTRE